jgi:hypothetical protein
VVGGNVAGSFEVPVASAITSWKVVVYFQESIL